MKRILSILLLMFMALPILTACQKIETTTTTTQGSSAGTTTTTTQGGSGGTTTTTQGGSGATTTTTSGTVDIPVRTGITGLSFTSSVTALAGTWKVVKVYADGNVSNAVSDAITLTITLDLDPYELVDGVAYIHNQLYNLAGIMTFGIADINTALGVDDVDNYRGSAFWDTFVMGKVVADGGWYEQPGPAIMTFRDIDDYGLFLNLVAGISADIDTTNKDLIIGMNNDGQLLLGYSSVHLERPTVTDGDWEYCLIFEK
jgi:hypothetical protein